jgi:uncharacterized protein
MASLARGYSGFGFSALLVASWSLVGSPVRAVAVALVLEVTASVLQAASVWRDIPWRRVGLLTGDAVLGTPLGTHLLAVTDEQTLRLGIAVFILLAAGALLSGLRLTARGTPLLVLAVGVASGACNGAVAMGGLPVAVFLTAEGASPRVLRASVVAYFFLLVLTTLFFLSREGLVGRESLSVAAVCFAGAGSSHVAGRPALLGGYAARIPPRHADASGAAGVAGHCARADVATHRSSAFHQGGHDDWPRGWYWPTRGNMTQPSHSLYVAQ